MPKPIFQTLLVLTVLFQFSQSSQTSGYNLGDDYNYDYYDTVPKANDKVATHNNKQSAYSQPDPSVLVTPKNSGVQAPPKLDDYYDYDYDKYDYQDVPKPESNGNQHLDMPKTHEFIDQISEEQKTEPLATTTTPSPAVTTRRSARDKLLTIMSKPGILAGIVGGAIIGVLTAILLIMFIVYRMKKKDEGSYALEETKKPLNAYDYRNCPTKEFYA